MAKKNLRVIPNIVQSKLKRIVGQYVIAGCSRVVSKADLERGMFSHLGIGIVNGRVSHPDALVPPKEQGKYSYRNINGREIKRRDLPMETKYHTITTPNFGDASKYGTNTRLQAYKRYPVDFEPPSLSRVNISAAEAPDRQAGFVLIFQVDKVLDKQSQGFNADLLTCLNLLQENVGFADVQESGTTIDSYLRTLEVDWEMLPPGTREEAIERLFRGKSPSSEERKRVEERWDFLHSLKPQKEIYGTSGFERYFGGEIRENLVIFENLHYGNAIYIMFENWQELSKRSRTELQSGRYGRDFERVPHSSGWKQEVKRIIKERLDGQRQRSSPAEAGQSG